jgi:N-acetylneuraminic acid mutarotase
MFVAQLVASLSFAFISPHASAQSGSTTTGVWTWMGGSSTINQPGVYGTKGTPAAANIPGSRYSALSWTDSSGNFWLFGGCASDTNSGVGYLNDLWKFNPSTNEWAWISGSSKYNQSGIYGTLGTPAAANIPGSRFSALSWTDSSGDFWLFGGYGYDANGKLDRLNDLWEFNPSTNEWAWISGSSTVAQSGIYGTLGTPANANIPGSRAYAMSWTDSSDNLWLFGGAGIDAKSNSGDLH